MWITGISLRNIRSTYKRFIPVQNLSDDTGHRIIQGKRKTGTVHYLFILFTGEPSTTVETRIGRG